MNPIKNAHIKRIVLLKGAVETLSYFSERLAETFLELGYQVQFYDFVNEFILVDLIWYCTKQKTALITFNYIGLCKEQAFQTPKGNSIWDEHDVLCVNIVVDHPFYYHKYMDHLPKYYLQYNLDRQHVAYMKRFFPDVSVSFLPLAGTILNEPEIPYEKRSIDILFTGNYTHPSIFENYINRLGDDYADFYQHILDDLIQNPSPPIDTAIENHLQSNIDDITEEGIKLCMPNMIFIDLYIRFYFRGKIIQTLVDHGIKVHVFGNGWDKLDCAHKENLIQGGIIKSKTCIEQMKLAKITLNIMPWFKDGAHDRIFNAVLNKSVCLTDSSRFLEDIFTNDETICFYSLEHIEELPKIVQTILNHPKKAALLAQNGYETALQNKHTWHDRALTLHNALSSYSFSE